MSNPYYVRLFDVSPLTFARSGGVEAEFERVEQGFDAAKVTFDAVDVYNAELTAARQGQASLLLNLQRYISTFAAAPGNIDLGGYLARNAGTPALPGDLASKGYVDGLVITATAPTWIPTDTAISKTLVSYESVTVTASGQTMLLPAAPTAGVTRVRVRNRDGISSTVDGNGKPIMALNETMSMGPGRWCELAFENNTDGWVLA